MLDSDNSESSESSVSWVEWFVSLKGNEFFCQVEDSYLLDKFNLTGLGLESTIYKQAYQIITDDYGKLFLYSDDLECLDDTKRIELEKIAKQLYGLIHSRYIITVPGLNRMVNVLFFYRMKSI